MDARVVRQTEFTYTLLPISLMVANCSGSISNSGVRLNRSTMPLHCGWYSVVCVFLVCKFRSAILTQTGHCGAVLEGKIDIHKLVSLVTTAYRPQVCTQTDCNINVKCSL